MSTSGQFPIDPESPVGQLRYLLGDTNATTSPTAPAGQKDFAVWSDAQIVASLAIAGGNLLRAAGQLVSQLALFYAQQGQYNVKADDLGLSVGTRGADLTAIAQSYYKEAADRENSSEDFFVAAPLRPTCTGGAW